MPNWAEGNLRIRGTKKNILDFLANELSWCAYSRKDPDEIMEFPVCVECDEYDTVHLTYPEALTTSNKILKLHIWLYIKGTKRNFIEPDVEMMMYHGEPYEKCCIIIPNFRAAWRADVAPYLEKAKRYGVDIKIVTYEHGAEFKQCIEIVDGVSVGYDCITFDDWYWEAEFPEMGG